MYKENSMDVDLDDVFDGNHRVNDYLFDDYKTVGVDTFRHRDPNLVSKDLKPFEHRTKGKLSVE
jgi:hypothetical protein